jgi:hypothetical protein
VGAEAPTHNLSKGALRLASRGLRQALIGSAIFSPRQALIGCHWPALIRLEFQHDVAIADARD